MIVISSSIVAALAADEQADYPVIAWESLISLVNADGETTDYPASNLLNTSTVEGWVSDTTDVQYVTCTVDGLIDYVAVARHNFGSAGIAVSVEGLTAEDGATWEELVQETLLGEDRPALFLFAETYLVGIRLKLQPVATAPAAAVLYAGQLLRMERGVQPGHTPIPYGRQREVVSGRSEGGDYLGRIVTRETLASTAEIRNLTPAWYRSTLDPFFAAAGEVPFFWAWRPETYPTEVGFAWLKNDPVPVPSHLAGYIDVTLQMQGIAL